MRTSLTQQQRLERDEAQIAAHGSRTVQHVQSSYRFQGRVDDQRLAMAIRALHDRHEVLRSRFPSVAEVVTDATAPEVLVLDSGSEDESARILAEWGARPFDLACGPPWRVVLVHEAGGRDVLSLVWDHLVVDGASVGTLEVQLGDAYRTGSVEAAPYTSYYDWAEEQRGVAGRLLREAATFYRDRWPGARPIPELWLPADRTPPDHVGPRAPAARHERVLPSEASLALTQRARATGTTPHRVLLAVQVAVLKRMARAPLNGFVMPVANRVEATAGTVGWFANLVLVPTVGPGWEGCAPLPQDLVDRSINEALAFTQLPGALLVDALEPGRRLDGRRHPFCYFDFVPVRRWRGGQWPGIDQIECLPEPADGYAVPGLATWLVSRGRGVFELSHQFERGVLADADLEEVTDRVIGALCWHGGEII